MAGVKGRSGRKDTLWADALRVAVTENLPDGRRKLRALAERVVDAALAGDMAAAKEIGDRLDGKAVQPTTLGGDPENPVELVTRIERAIVRANAAD